MQDFRAVFAVSVPLMVGCLVGSTIVKNEVSRGDKEEERGRLMEDRGRRGGDDNAFGEVCLRGEG